MRSRRNQLYDAYNDHGRRRRAYARNVDLIRNGKKLAGTLLVPDVTRSSVSVSPS
jgi:hypothetical protein